MTNPSLTPSVPLSTSKDKSCIEYKHWILPCDNAKHLCWIHYKKSKFLKIKPAFSRNLIINYWLFIIKENGHVKLWPLAYSLETHQMDVNPYTPCNVTFRNSQWEHWILFLAFDLCRPLLESYFCLLLEKGQLVSHRLVGGRKPLGDKWLLYTYGEKRCCMTSGLLNREKKELTINIWLESLLIFSDISTLYYIRATSKDFLKEINVAHIINF